LVPRRRGLLQHPRASACETLAVRLGLVAQLPCVRLLRSASTELGTPVYGALHLGSSCSPAFAAAAAFPTPRGRAGRVHDVQDGGRATRPQGPPRLPLRC
jgi:hypothetical protein